MLKKSLYIGAFFFLSSCTCGTPLQITSIQSDDKKLACKDVILEINEAEHYRDQAAGEQGINFDEALMPVCWVSGFVDGAEAVKAANARIDYLGRIYELLDCGGNEGRVSSSIDGAPPPPPAVVVAPPAAVPARVPPYPSAQSFSAPVPPPVATSVLRETGGYYKHRQDLGQNMHEHRDSRGKIYIHSHPNTGGHRHLED